jgi:chaperonin GroES
MTIEKRKPKKEQDNMTGKLQPLADRLMVKPIAEEDKTKSGIYIPDTAKEKPQEGEILAAGPGRMTEDGKRVPIDVKVGDIILYSKYGGTEIKIGGEELIILRESDVLAVKIRKVK